MPDTCVGFKCHNRRGQVPGKSFYRLPKDKDKRQLWISAIKRGDPSDQKKQWNPKEDSKYYVCADHFIGGRWDFLIGFTMVELLICIISADYL